MYRTLNPQRSAAARRSLLQLWAVALIVALLLPPAGSLAAPAQLPQASVAFAAPPWCGTPMPDATAALPDGSNPSDPVGSFPHIPWYAIACTLADIQARSNGRMEVKVLGQSALRSGYVPGDDQRARHAPAAQGLPDLAEHPQDRPDRAGTGARDARPGGRRCEGPDLHPVGHPRQRVGRRGRHVRAGRAAGDDAVRRGSRGRRHPEPRGPALERRSTTRTGGSSASAATATTST